MIDLALAILTLGLKPLYDKNLSYSKIIIDFRNKLPRLQNQAKELTEKEKANSPFFSGILKSMSILNLSPHRTSISEVEIDEFYNKLNNFDYRFMFFKTHYKNYTRNLNRFNPKAENKNFDLAILQIAIQENPLHPIKPIPILFYYIKYKFKFSSRIYLRYRNLKRKT